MTSALGTQPLVIDDFASRLEAMTQQARVKAVRAMKKTDMIRLWQACQGRDASLEDFVPADVPTGVEVIHEGKNSLPVATIFQKRFTRGTGDDAGSVLYGYNHNLFTFTTAGPGYFLAHHDDAFGALGLNYYRVPGQTAELPPGWPTVRKNERGLQRFIYAKMVDYMRSVCDGVTIGRAWVKGKRTDNYFMLVRTQ